MSIAGRTVDAFATLHAFTSALYGVCLQAGKHYRESSSSFSIELWWTRHSLLPGKVIVMMVVLETFVLRRESNRPTRLHFGTQRIIMRAQLPGSEAREDTDVSSADEKCLRWRWRTQRARKFNLQSHFNHCFLCYPRLRPKALFVSPKAQRNMLYAMAVWECAHNADTFGSHRW